MYIPDCLSYSVYAELDSAGRIGANLLFALAVKRRILAVPFLNLLKVYHLASHYLLQSEDLVGTGKV